MQYHQIKIKTNSRAKPSFFIGSTLRGAFGHALKETTCINPSYKCKGCFAKDNCLYYEFYEESQGYRPFRFEVGLGSLTYDFSLFLFFNEGREEDISDVVSALKLMLSKYGLGKELLKFPNAQLSIETLSFLSQTNALNSSSSVTIKFITPSLIKDANSKFKTDLDLEDVLASIYKRKSFFEEGNAYVKMPFVPKYKLLSKKYNSSVKTSRQSSRQNKKMVLTGVTGELTVSNLDIESYKLLKYAEVVAIGNKTALGYGRVSIEQNI